LLNQTYSFAFGVFDGILGALNPSIRLHQCCMLLRILVIASDIIAFAQINCFINDLLRQSVCLPHLRAILRP
jgi:hypothetical protein